MNEDLNDISSSMEYSNEEKGNCEENEKQVNEDAEENDNEQVNENGEEMNGVDKQIDVPKVGMVFGSYDKLFDYYTAYGSQEGFAVTKLTQKKRGGLLRYITVACARSGGSKTKAKNPIKPQTTTKTDCPARLNAILCPSGKWKVTKVVVDHNHAKSPNNSRFFARNRFVSSDMTRQLEVNDRAKVRMTKSFNGFEGQVGRPGNLAFIEKDGQNYIEEMGWLRLREGDVAAMQKFFSKMQENNSSFFYRVDLDAEGCLKNVFWADERSRAAYEEFGDVITFDTTYLTSKYDMPLATFVGVNHHGQLTLLGCGLISREDTETFSWLFKAWLACMHGNAPSGIITDQDKAIQNAVEVVFPNSRHRWCLWHIMKKLPEKVKGSKIYESISSVLQNVVYGSLTPNEFEDRWNGMIEEFHLENNEWFLGLFSERRRWVPAFVKDSFWAGMSITQRTESVHAFFNGYVDSMTTLKQFVEQYENALKNKLEKEKLEDSKSCNSCIRSISPYAMEKQVQGVYTNAKFQEFQHEMRGLICCGLYSSQKHGAVLECEVKEDVEVGGKTRRVNFKVWFSRKECEDEVEVKCNCCLFEFRGILCRHALSVLINNEFFNIPDKYILRRWRKDIKRRHTKVRVNYDDWKAKPEGRRLDKMCATFHEVAELAMVSDNKCDMVMDWIMKLNGALEGSDEIHVSSQTSPTSISESSTGSAVNCISKKSPIIFTSSWVRNKGGPPVRRKQSTEEQIIETEVKSKKICTHDGSTNSEVAEVIGTQESIAVAAVVCLIQPQGAGYGFQQQPMSMNGMMPSQVADGLQHSIMPGPPSFPPQLCQPSTFSQLMRQQGNTQLERKGETLKESSN